MNLIKKIGVLILWYFASTAIFITLLLLILMPKNLSTKEIYVTWWTLAYLVLVVDIILGATYDLFDYGGDKDITVPDLLFEATMAPFAGIIFLNFMPKEKKKFFLYTLLWTFLATVFEWLSVKNELLDYKGWNLFFSIPFYPLTSIFLRLHLAFLRR